MKVKIRFYGALREIIKTDSIEFVFDKKINLIELFEKMINKYPQLSEFIEIRDENLYVRGLSIIVNGRHIIFLDLRNHELQEDSIIDILPPVKGGYKLGSFNSQLNCLEKIKIFEHINIQY
jgi:molybdopterin converting factor small subunit